MSFDPDFAAKIIRSLRASKACEKHWKIKRISLVPPDISLSLLFGSSIASRWGRFSAFAPYTRWIYIRQINYPLSISVKLHITLLKKPGGSILIPIDV